MVKGGPSGAVLSDEILKKTGPESRVSRSPLRDACRRLLVRIACPPLGVFLAKMNQVCEVASMLMPLRSPLLFIDASFSLLPTSREEVQEARSVGHWDRHD